MRSHCSILSESQWVWVKIGHWPSGPYIVIGEEKAELIRVYQREWAKFQESLGSTGWMRQGDISAPEDVTEDFKEDHEISDSWRRAKDTFSRQLGVVRTTLVWIQRGGLWISALLLTSSPCTWEALLYNLLKSCFFFFFLSSRSVFGCYILSPLLNSLCKGIFDPFAHCNRSSCQMLLVSSSFLCCPQFFMCVPLWNVI